MTGTREQILSALFALVETIPSASTFSRRLWQFPTVAPEIQPAVFQIEEEEQVIRRGVGTPPTRYLLPQIWFFAQSGPLDQSTSASPGATAVNTFLDQLETALLPDNKILNRLTLGGLCYWCRYEGRVPKVAGNWGTQAMCIAKIRILMP